MKDLFFPDEKVVRLVLDFLRSDAYKNDIKIVCAPFEAEWQLVELEMKGEIDAIISADSDFVFLGAKKLLLDVSYYRQSPTCNVYERDRDLAGGRYNCRLHTQTLLLQPLLVLLAMTTSRGKRGME